MTNHSSLSLPALLLSIASTACAGQAPECPPAEGVALQVLGSGGPIADDGRASSGYIVWVDGKSRVLVDAGGGTFLRFGEADANFVDLENARPDTRKGFFYRRFRRLEPGIQIGSAPTGLGQLLHI